MSEKKPKQTPKAVQVKLGKQTPMPKGFIYYDQIQKEEKERELTKENKK